MCLVKMSNFKLPASVFIVHRCESMGITVKIFIITQCNERQCSVLLSANGFQPHVDTMLEIIELN